MSMLKVGAKIRILKDGANNALVEEGEELEVISIEDEYSFMVTNNHGDWYLEPDAENEDWELATKPQPKEHTMNDWKTTTIQLTIKHHPQQQMSDWGADSWQDTLSGDDPIPGDEFQVLEVQDRTLFAAGSTK
jgi:hypothetical protein